MSAKCLRLFRIVRIMETEGHITIDTIRKTMKTSERTAYRDIASLRSMKVPVTTDGHVLKLDMDRWEAWPTIGLKRGKHT